MTQPVIRVENLSKAYRLGQIGTGTLTNDLKVWWAKARGKSNPLLKIGEQDHGNRDGETVWALQDVSFTVEQGEVLGIIGRNGAGKSTLLKILSRITAPTEGVVKVRGRIASLLEVGTGFHPELTGRENIYLNGAILGMSRAEVQKKLDEIVDFAEIEKFLDTPVKRYSSGMYVRLAFAVAAHLDSEILLVDEVLAVGDAEFQKKCLGKMGEVAREKRTVLFVSHNMGSINQLCPRSILIHEGKIAKDSITSEVIADYLREFSKLIAERRWGGIDVCPGDDRVRLLSGRLLQNDLISEVIDINQPLVVQFEFAVLKEITNLVSGINVYNAEGTCLFANCDWRENKLSPGIYTKDVLIPPQTLNEGLTKVLMQLIFLPPNIRSVVQYDALIFEAIESNHANTIRGRYKNKWPGLIRLGLHWNEAVKIRE